MLNQPDSPEPLLPKPEFPPIPALKKPDEGVALELKYPGPAGIANPPMVVLGRWMLAMVSAGVVRPPSPPLDGELWRGDLRDIDLGEGETAKSDRVDGERWSRYLGRHDLRKRETTQRYRIDRERRVVIAGMLSCGSVNPPSVIGSMVNSGVVNC
ncbi:PPE family protein PPE35 [Mycobacterium tuberculosis variant africanum]|nr:PPE family protein PPE35 [Mycobacterium tuberculosis variant africanum]